MRIIVRMIGLILTITIGIQSYVAAVGGETSQEGWVAGIFVFLLYLLGSAFAISVPWASVWMFAIAGAIGLIAGYQTAFSYLILWGTSGIILSLISLFAVREKKDKEEAEEG